MCVGKNVWVCVCVCVCVRERERERERERRACACMYACIRVCMYVSMYVCVNECMYVFKHACMDVDVCMYMCIMCERKYEIFHKHIVASVRTKSDMMVSWRETHQIVDSREMWVETALFIWCARFMFQPLHFWWWSILTSSSYLLLWFSWPWLKAKVARDSNLICWEKSSDGHWKAFVKQGLLFPGGVWSFSNSSPPRRWRGNKSGLLCPDQHAVMSSWPSTAQTLPWICRPAQVNVQADGHTNAADIATDQLLGRGAERLDDLSGGQTRALQRRSPWKRSKKKNDHHPPPPPPPKKTQQTSTTTTTKQEAACSKAGNDLWSTRSTFLGSILFLQNEVTETFFFFFFLAPGGLLFLFHWTHGKHANVRLHMARTHIRANHNLSQRFSESITHIIHWYTEASARIVKFVKMSTKHVTYPTHTHSYTRARARTKARKHACTPIHAHTHTHYAAYSLNARCLTQAHASTCTEVNKKSRCSNDQYSPYLLGFFTVISLIQPTITVVWVASCNLWLPTAQILAFPVSLLPWVKIKVIQTESKLLCILVFSIIPILIQFRSQISWQMMLLNVYLINHVSRVLALEYYFCQIKLQWCSTSQQVDNMLL